MNIESIGNNQYALEGMTENELRPGTWRNLAGAERKNKIGKTVNAKGARSITLFIPDENLQFFIEVIEHNQAVISRFHKVLKCGQLCFRILTAKLPCIHPFCQSCITNVDFFSKFAL